MVTTKGQVVDSDMFTNIHADVTTTPTLRVPGAFGNKMSKYKLLSSPINQ